MRRDLLQTLAAVVPLTGPTAVLAGDLASKTNIRRVVVAEKPDGTSFIASDIPVAGVEAKGVGSLFTMWGNDHAAKFPDDGAQPDINGLYPPVGGYRVYFTRFPAGQTVTPDKTDLTGGDAKVGGGVPGMHKSDTTDFNIVLTGQMDCVLSDGTTVSLKQGDTIVLNGADHAWRNTGTTDALVVFFMAGASRK